MFLCLPQPTAKKVLIKLFGKFAVSKGRAFGKIALPIASRVRAGVALCAGVSFWFFFFCGYSLQRKRTKRTLFVLLHWRFFRGNLFKKFSTATVHNPLNPGTPFFPTKRNVRSRGSAPTRFLFQGPAPYRYLCQGPAPTPRRLLKKAGENFICGKDGTLKSF